MLKLKREGFTFLVEAVESVESSAFMAFLAYPFLSNHSFYSIFLKIIPREIRFDPHIVREVGQFRTTVEKAWITDPL